MNDQTAIIEQIKLAAKMMDDQPVPLPTAMVIDGEYLSFEQTTDKVSIESIFPWMPQ
jgi:hypothetical protein